MAELVGSSVDGYGVRGMSTNAVGVVGDTASKFAAVWAHNRGSGTGVLGSSDGAGVGVGPKHPPLGRLRPRTPRRVRGGDTRGVVGISEATSGTPGAAGVVGASEHGIGVRGESGSATGRGGVFFGGVDVNGNLTVINGNKPFKIDHPLDPQNKYLLHNAVESSEMKNVYDGVARLDEDGTAWVDLPEWFQSLNGDFRYQLTAVGGAAPNLHVVEEIYENNRFKIAGGEGGMKVCWQVTGTRKDRWAAANPFEVEQEKPQEERGRYLQPDLYDAPEEQSVMRALMGEERPWEMRQEPPQPPEFPLPPQQPPQEPAMPPPAFGLEGELLRQINELRGQIEGLRRGRLEEEIDELRGQIKKLRRRRKR